MAKTGYVLRLPNEITIAEGLDTLPIAEGTTAIVEGTPGANQVKLTKNDSSYRW